jgi:hypothetical protein
MHKREHQGIRATKTARQQHRLDEQQAQQNQIIICLIVLQ